jgi:6-pyruvoyltetrahydropterin/6-carboxytetrahydropterin synthase
MNAAQYQVIKKISFCYGHRLLGHQGKCKNLHGHNATLEIVLQNNQLDPLGMVVDFADVKKIMKNYIDEKIDHKMILFKQDPYIEILKKQNEPLFVMDQNPTAENLAKHLFEIAKDHKLPVVEVRLFETETSIAVYHE